MGNLPTNMTGNVLVLFTLVLSVTLAAGVGRVLSGATHLVRIRVQPNPLPRNRSGQD